MSIGKMYVTAWVPFPVFFIGGVAVAGTLGSVPLFIISIVGAVVSFVYAMYLSLRVLRNDDPRLLKRGIRPTATGLSAKRMRTVIQAGEFDWQAPLVRKYRLKVTIPGREPYETDSSICAELFEAQEVAVAIAPHNHQRVTVDVGLGAPKRGNDDRIAGLLR